MNASTLAKIFATIPNDVMFPWDVHAAAASGSAAKGPQKAIAAVSVLPTGDEAADDGRVEQASDADGDEGEESEGFAGFGGLDGAEVGIDLMHAERTAAEERAARDFDRKAAAVAQLASVPKRVASVAVGEKRQRTLLRTSARLDANDPDVLAVQRMLDANAAASSAWAEQRDAMTADEQEALLLVPGRESCGAICLFHESKGFGFIAPDCGGPDIYFTRDSVDPAIAGPSQPSQPPQRPVLIPGERVSFTVSLNGPAASSSRRLRTTSVRIDGGGSSAMAAALGGRLFTGRIRGLQRDSGRGTIESLEADLDGQEAAAGLTAIGRCHILGGIDAAFAIDMSRPTSVPQLGDTVTYYLMPLLDIKTGRALAVGLQLTRAPDEAEYVDPAQSRGPQVDEHQATKALRVERDFHHVPQALPPVVAPVLLLGDDGDMGGW